VAVDSVSRFLGSFSMISDTREFMDEEFRWLCPVGLTKQGPSGMSAPDPDSTVPESAARFRQYSRVCRSG